MTLLELIESYGPVVFSNPELGYVIQRNGAYMNLGVEGRDGWYHSDCRHVEQDAYNTTMARAIEEARAWAGEIEGGEEDEEVA